MYEKLYRFAVPEGTRVWAEYDGERTNMFPLKHRHPLHFLWSVINLPILVWNFFLGWHIYSLFISESSWNGFLVGLHLAVYIVALRALDEEF